MKTSFVLLSFALASALPSFGSSFYVGSDTACFYSFSDSTCPLTSGESTFGVTLSGNPLMSYTPDSGFDAPATGGPIELGTFSVNEALLGVVGGNFDLNIEFTAPGGGGNTYSATELGLVVLGAGGAEVSFSDPLTQLYTYPGGEFEVTLPSGPILIGAGDQYTLDAVITPIASTPEPASLASGGAALMLLACALWRRRITKTVSL